MRKIITTILLLFVVSQYCCAIDENQQQRVNSQRFEAELQKRGFSSNGLWNNPYQDIPIESVHSLLVGQSGESGRLEQARKLENTPAVQEIFRKISRTPLTYTWQRVKTTHPSGPYVFLNADGGIVASVMSYSRTDRVEFRHAVRNGDSIVVDEQTDNINGKKIWPSYMVSSDHFDESVQVALNAKFIEDVATEDVNNVFRLWASVFRKEPQSTLGLWMTKTLLFAIVHNQDKVAVFSSIRPELKPTIRSCRVILKSENGLRFQTGTVEEGNVTWSPPKHDELKTIGVHIDDSYVHQMPSEIREIHVIYISYLDNGEAVEMGKKVFPLPFSRQEMQENTKKEIAIYGELGAGHILKENGFKVGRKHSPTGSEDYFVVHIKLRERIPHSSTIAEILGTKSKNARGYAVLEAGGDNKIFRIQ